MTATVEALQELHKVLAEALTEKVQAEDSAASFFAVAAKFLKDNSITADAGSNEAMDALAKALAARQNSGRGAPKITPEERKELTSIDHLMH